MHLNEKIQHNKISLLGNDQFYIKLSNIKHVQDFGKLYKISQYFELQIQLHT